MSTEQLSTLGTALRRTLDGRYHEEKEQLRRDLDADVLLRDPGLDSEAARAWTTDTLQYLADRGHGAIGWPTSEVDSGDIEATVLNFEMCAHADLSLTVKSGVQFGLFGGAVANLGTAWHLETFGPDINAGRLLGCFAMTERGHGSDVQSLQTTITFVPGDDDGGGFVVDSPTSSATKTYIGNAARDGRMAVVFGQLRTPRTDEPDALEQHGVHAVLVPIRDDAGHPMPGVTLGDNGHKGGLLGVDNGTIAFDAVRVPRTHLLDRYGGVDEHGRYSSPVESPNRRFFTMLGTLVRGRVCVAAGGGAAARKGLSIATRYALTRRQFTADGHDGEVLLLDYLAHQRKLLPAIAEAYALGFAQTLLTRTLHDVRTASSVDQRAQRELEAMAAGMKATSTRFANDTIQMCREACGGAGYLSSSGLPLLRADADVFATFEGDNTVLLQLVAKGLITGYQAMWGDLDMLGMVQAAARTVGGVVLERTSVRPLIERLMAVRSSDEERVLDRSWQLRMFHEREQHVLESLAGRLRTARGAEPEDAFAAFNMTQDHVLLAARTHMDRVILEAFAAAVETCEDADARRVLDDLCSLYALNSIDRDRGWFQEHNRMSAPRAKSLVVTVNELCSRLRPDALALVEGMGVPVPWLGSDLVTGAELPTDADRHGGGPRAASSEDVAVARTEPVTAGDNGGVEADRAAEPAPAG